MYRKIINRKSAESAFKPKQTAVRNAAKLNLNFRFLFNTKLYPLIFFNFYPPPWPLRHLGALPAAATLPANPIPDQRPTKKRERERDG